MRNKQNSNEPTNHAHTVNYIRRNIVFENTGGIQPAFKDASINAKLVLDLSPAADESMWKVGLPCSADLRDLIDPFVVSPSATQRWASAARTNRRQRQALHERHADCASAACRC